MYFKEWYNVKCETHNGNFRQKSNVILLHTKGNKMGKTFNDAYFGQKLCKRHSLLIVFCMFSELYIGFVILPVWSKLKVAN